MYKAICNNKIIAVVDMTEGEPFPFMIYDEVIEDKDHVADDYVHLDDEFVLKTDERYITSCKDNMRNVRNHFLSEFVDTVVTNPLRWSELSEEDKQMIKDYRRYLLDFTKSENWWEATPQTFEEWKGKPNAN